MLSLSECIPWMTVGLVESAAIVTLHLCTIIVFIRNCNLRKLSTYLVINFSVIDMFVGGVVVYYLFYCLRTNCNVWKWHSMEYGTYIFTEVLIVIFPIGTSINIAIIALERVHSTLKHRVLRKWVHRLIIAVIWATSGLVSVSFMLLRQFEKNILFRTRSFLFKSVEEHSLITMVQPVEKEN